MSSSALAFCITHTSATEHLTYLALFAVWTAFPFLTLPRSLPCPAFCPSEVELVAQESHALLLPCYTGIKRRRETAHRPSSADRRGWKAVGPQRAVMPRRSAASDGSVRYSRPAPVLPHSFSPLFFLA